MKQTLKRIFMSSVVFALILTPAIVSAQDGDTSVSSPTDSSVAPERKLPSAERIRAYEQQLKAELLRKQQARQAAISDKRDELKQRLTESKRRICEKNQTRISMLMNGMDMRRQTAFMKIASVFEAVQKFQDEKQLPVTGYEELIAAATAAKSTAETTMTAQKAVPELNCNGDHPKADVAEFKEKRASSIDAMKAYRDAIKSLITAVRAAAQEGSPDAE